MVHLFHCKATVPFLWHSLTLWWDDSYGLWSSTCWEDTTNSLLMFDVESWLMFVDDVALLSCLLQKFEVCYHEDVRLKRKNNGIIVSLCEHRGAKILFENSGV
ncbi:hypothetical protein ACB092_10G188700 [Castanea dentata]